MCTHGWPLWGVTPGVFVKNFKWGKISLSDRRENQNCKSRIFRMHSIFVSWALRPFIHMKFSHSRWPVRILWLASYLSHAFYFRTEAASYKIYENNMHTKYSGFTVSVVEVSMLSEYLLLNILYIDLLYMKIGHSKSYVLTRFVCMLMLCQRGWPVSRTSIKKH